MSVTLPLIKDSFFSGLVTAFVRSITAISAIILLVTPEFLLITCQINEQAEKGNYGVACAYATVLILITYGAVLIMRTAAKFFLYDSLITRHRLSSGNFTIPIARMAPRLMEAITSPVK